MKRILINATQREELRVAIVDGQKLHDLDIEIAGREQKKSNIYKGKITRIEPSLEACFVEYGSQRHGFLPLKEIAKSYYRQPSGSIREVLAEGMELIVQVEKEERGNKGAALTTYISLAGRYLVLMPNNPRAGGVSRRAEGDERQEAKAALESMKLPQGMGVIVRSNGVGRNAEELQWDADYLADIWRAIEKAAEDKPAPFLIYQENNIILRALRDYLRPDIGEVVIDHEQIFAEARRHLELVMPQSLKLLKLHQDDTPLFSRFQIESQIELAHERTIRLPSGGSIVIDRTEALTSIDINSAKSTGGGSIEDTALNTNLEAADEIARQLRLRDLGGLVVIDFIDMNASKNQKEVEKRLEKACEIDRARIQVGRISRFGLLEMSRQRLRPTLAEHTQLSCPRCSGQGHIRSVESISLSVLRLIEEEAMKDRTGRVIVQVPLDVGTFLLNEKRIDVREIESRCRVTVAVIPNATLQSPHFEIRRVRGDQLQQDDNAAWSHLLAQNFDADAIEQMAESRPAARSEAAAVKQITPSAPAPQPIAPAPAMKTTEGESFWSKLLKLLGVGPKPPPKPKKAPPRNRRTAPNKEDSKRRADASKSRSNNAQRGQNQRRGERSQAAQNKNQPKKDNTASSAKNSGARNAGAESSNNNTKSGGNNGNNEGRRSRRGRRGRGRGERQGERAASVNRDNLPPDLAAALMQTPEQAQTKQPKAASASPQAVPAPSTEKTEQPKPDTPTPTSGAAEHSTPVETVAAVHDPIADAETSPVAEAVKPEPAPVSPVQCTQSAPPETTPPEIEPQADEAEAPAQNAGITSPNSLSSTGGGPFENVETRFPAPPPSISAEPQTIATAEPTEAPGLQADVHTESAPVEPPQQDAETSAPAPEPEPVELEVEAVTEEPAATTEESRTAPSADEAVEAITQTEDETPAESPSSEPASPFVQVETRFPASGSTQTRN